LLQRRSDWSSSVQAEVSFLVYLEGNQSVAIGRHPHSGQDEIGAYRHDRVWLTAKHRYGKERVGGIASRRILSDYKNAFVIRRPPGRVPGLPTPRQWGGGRGVQITQLQSSAANRSGGIDERLSIVGPERS